MESYLGRLFHSGCSAHKPPALNRFYVTLECRVAASMSFKNLSHLISCHYRIQVTTFRSCRHFSCHFIRIHVTYFHITLEISHLLSCHHRVCHLVSFTSLSHLSQRQQTESLTSCVVLAAPPLKEQAWPRGGQGLLEGREALHQPCHQAHEGAGRGLLVPGAAQGEGCRQQQHQHDAATPPCHNTRACRS